jgi:mitogen-activated protein kinase kinase kinase
LLECDQKILQEMGIKKVGDRVRIFVAIKQLRTKTGPTCRAKNMVRSIALLTMNHVLMSEDSKLWLH